MLLGVSRSSVYYNHVQEKEENLKLMELIRERYLEDSIYGARRMRAYLEKEHSLKVNLKRVRRLMRKMCIQEIHPAPKKTISQDTEYNNLLRTLSVSRPNQVWCSDITYIRVKNGFGYAVAIMDLFSRKVLSLKILNTVDNNFCLEAASETIRRYDSPVIIHTDRGKQFMGDDFTSVFKENGTKISVGERGFKDNIVLERFWRTYK